MRWHSWPEPLPPISFEARDALPQPHDGDLVNIEDRELQVYQSGLRQWATIERVVERD